MRRSSALLLVVLLAAGSVPTPGAAGAPTPVVEWWGPAEVGEGFHIRVPLTVTNDRDFPMGHPVAAAQLDLGEALREAGWISTPQGDLDILQSFVLGLETVRVVEVTNHLPPQPGSANGRLRAVDTAREGDARYEVPVMVLPGYLDRSQPRPFHNATNPIVTVLWEVPGTLEPGAQRHFMLYLDTPLNFRRPLDEVHPPRDWTDDPAHARLQALHWSGAGLDLVGVALPDQTGSGSVTLVGLHGGTTVTVLSDGGTGRLQPVQPPPGFPPNPLTLQANEVVEVYAGSGTSVVRVVADKPVVAYGVGAGFVPSTDRGMVGNEFVFAKTKPVSAEDDTIHFINVGDRPTTIQLQPLVPDGNAETYRMSDQTNPYPYTVGHRSNVGAFSSAGQGCTDPGHPNRLLDAPGVFRAVVVSGGPVLLQHAPSDGLVQVPTREGAPTGSELYSATGWTDRNVFQQAPSPPPGNPRGGAFCAPTNRVGGWFASGMDGPSGVRVTSPESTSQVDPPGTSTPPRPVSAAPDVVGRHPAPLLDRPLVFTAEDGDVALFTGHLTPAGSPDRVPIVHGPLGGDDGGRRFVSLGPTAVYAPYPNTIVTAELSLSVSGVVERQVKLSAHGIHVFEGLSKNDWLYGLSIEADKPVIAYPTRAPPTTLAAVPTFPRVDVGPAEFRGHLVEVSSASGLDPLTGSTVVGTPVTYALRVTNHGRQVGGAGLSDTVDLSVVPPPGWSAELDRDAVPLEGGHSAEVHLTVTPGAGVEPGSLGAVEVKATSRGNPQMSDVLRTITYIKRSFDVGLWFELVSGPKEMARTIATGDPAEFTLVVKNEGSVADAVRLETTIPPQGWDLLLLDGGREAPEIRLEAGEVRRLTLRATPPPEASDGLLITTVTAQSVSSPAALDRVTATAKLRTPSDLTLEAEADRVFVDPGGTAVFPLVLQNRGGGVAEVLLEATSDAIPGWSPPAVYVEDPATGARVNLTKISLAPGDALHLRVATTAPVGAGAGSSLGIRFEGLQTQSQEVLEALLYALVRPVHDLQVQTPRGALAWDGEEDALEVPVRLTNLGNLDENLTWRLLDVPLGWGLDAPEDILVPRNGTQAFAARLTVPPREATGLYNVTVALVSGDGHARTFDLQVAVGTVAQVRHGAPGTVAAQPGRPAVADIPVANNGNVPVSVTVAPADGSWGLEPTDALVLPPGANATLRVAWQVPRDATDGARAQGVRLTLDPLAEDGVTTSLDVPATLDVGRPDLRLLDFRTYEGPTGLLVDGAVENTGTRTAEAFTVHLMSEGEMVERVTISSLPPGQRSQLRLLLPDGESWKPAVVVDPDDVVVESDEGNNVLSVEPDARRDAPGVGLLHVAGMAAASAWVARRRSGPA